MTTEAHIHQLRIEIGQLEIVNRNHADWCKSEIVKRQRAIEILLEQEQKSQNQAFAMQNAQVDTSDAKTA